MTVWLLHFLKKYNSYKELRTIRPITPYPGCPMYHEAIEKGMLSGPDDFYNKFKNSDLLTVNFTRLTGKQFYDLLYHANYDLIWDHQRHSDMPSTEAHNMTRAFKALYCGGETDFRGARHFTKTGVMA